MRTNQLRRTQVATLPPAVAVRSVQSDASAAPTSVGDAVTLPPRAAALRSARAYADAAGSDRPVDEKLAVFRDRFHAKAEFRGPVFGHLTGDQVYGKLAIEGGSGAKINYQPIGAGDVRKLSSAEVAAIDPKAAGESWHAVTTKWQADYKLAGNAIHNDVTTQLTVDADGKIRQHTDNFDHKRWMDQAVPWMPRVIRHSEPLRRVANFALGLTTHFKGRSL